jgi:fatty acid desaturase
MSSPQPATEPSSPRPRAARRLERLLLRFGTVGQLLMLFARGGRWWMLPLIAILAVLAVAMVGLQSVQVLAPFIYAVL